MNALAIFTAHWLAWKHRLFRGSRARRLAGLILFLLWYGAWAALAAWAACALAAEQDPAALERLLAPGLLIVALYWQLVRTLALAAGAGLDWRRLLIYPVTPGRLFWLELAVRLAATVELLVALAGAAAGLWRNSAAPPWAPAALACFAAWNLLLAVALCRLLERLLARRYVREALFLILVLVVALPQVILLRVSPESLERWLAPATAWWWPWSAAAQAALGRGWSPWAALAFWIAAAWVFARDQFRRSLRFDRAELPAGRARAQESLPARLLRLLWQAFPDPVAAVAHKELLVLARSPRFRLVFIMGFTFGLLIWLPLLAGDAAVRLPFLTSGYLALVSAYAMLLLGEATFWNAFALDRSAAQIYFVSPTPPLRLLLGKNLAAAAAVLAEVTLVAVACAAIGMPVTTRHAAEAYLVTLVLALYLFSAGNFASVWYPRPADPASPWRPVARSRFQALLLLSFPALAMPVIVAYLLRWSLGSDFAFLGALGAAGGLGALLYRHCLTRTAAALVQRRERLLEELSGHSEPGLS